ncbi:Rieske (2Fe-2S) protein [Janibacter sp. G349]|uniref:Rieske (2Fe-2S) protein n=1 Tax=unclassified Janibacter TaxID=2649294 RepID=UPI003B7AE089
MAVTLLPKKHNGFRAEGSREFVVRRHDDGQTIIHGLQCPHRGGPLWLGAFEDTFIRCPWHGMKTRIPNPGSPRAPFCLARSGEDIYVIGLQVENTFRVSPLDNGGC